MEDEELQKRDKRKRVIKSTALALAVGFTAYSAIVSTISVQKSQDALDTVQRVSFCNTQILGQALVALNQRSTYTKKQADANLELQRAQAALLLPSLNRETPSTPEEGQRALARYFDALTQYTKTAESARDKAVNTPYPTNEDIAKCIDGEEELNTPLVPTEEPSPEQ